MDKLISHYQLLSKIASGGMATVHLALDTVTNTKVAIKVLKEEVSNKEKILERFTQEGLLNLNHPNIVKILDAGVHENTPYIVMEYIEGRDLEDLIKDKKRLTVSKALSIFTQLLSALSYVHSFAIIHRDIKPKNILIDKSGKVKLTDFGIAKSQYSHVKTSTGGYLGAPAYSSPEQMDGLTLDARSDIYSLGITFYEMLSGVTPFSSISIPNLIKEKFTGKYRQIGTYRPDVPSYIISVIDKCIAVNPKDRFGSVEEIVNALNRFYSSGTIIIGPKPKRANSIKKIAFISTLAAIAMLIIIIIMSVNLSNKNSQLSKVTAISSPSSTMGTQVDTISAAAETTTLTKIEDKTTKTIDLDYTQAIAQEVLVAINNDDYSSVSIYFNKEFKDDLINSIDPKTQKAYTSEKDAFINILCKPLKDKIGEYQQDRLKFDRTLTEEGYTNVFFLSKYSKELSGDVTAQFVFKNESGKMTISGLWFSSKTLAE